MAGPDDGITIRILEDGSWWWWPWLRRWRVTSPPSSRWISAMARSARVWIAASTLSVSIRTEPSSRVSVELLRAEEYLRIAAHDRGTRDVLRVASLPAGKRLASGSHLVLISSVERIYSQLERRQRERAALVDEFVQAYPRIVEDAKQRLRGAFDVASFPGASLSEGGAVEVSEGGLQVMRDAFATEYELEVSSREAGVLAAQGSLSQEFIRRELARARASGEALVSEIRDGLRVAFAELVDGAVEMLQPGPDGGRKKFMGARLEKIQNFLASFDDRNVAGDGDLAAVVRQARDILADVDTVALKDARQRNERDNLGAALAKVQGELRGIVQTRKRLVRLGDDVV